MTTSTSQQVLSNKSDMIFFTHERAVRELAQESLDHMQTSPNEIVILCIEARADWCKGLINILESDDDDDYDSNSENLEGDESEIKIIVASNEIRQTLAETFPDIEHLCFTAPASGCVGVFVLTSNEVSMYQVEPIAQEYLH